MKKIFTIGFAGKSAEQFFALLQQAGAVKLIDTRLNNVSQLAGFTKRRDLEYFLRVIAGIHYVHDLELAPTADMLDNFKKGRSSWDEYQARYTQLLIDRALVERRQAADFDHACLLCSEPKPDHCHRRLAAEILQRAWPDLNIEHL